MAWSRDAFNCTCTSANPEFKSPHKVYSGKQAPLRLLPFIAPRVFRMKLTSKDRPNAVPCVRVRSVKNHPSGTAGG